MRVVVAFVALAALRGQDLTLDQIRRINLDRAANLPNFIADETVTHYISRREGAPWIRNHTFQAEITVRGTQISRRNVLRDGSPWDKTLKANSGMAADMPATGFGAALQALFDPQCSTALTPAGTEEMRGKTALVYGFRSPANGCFGNLYGGSAYNAARSGRVFIDATTGDVLQFEEQATGLPKGFVFTQRNQVMTWNRVPIGDAAYWLPVFADFIWKTPEGHLTRSTVEYKNHRHFEAQTNFIVK